MLETLKVISIIFYFVIAHVSIECLMRILWKHIGKEWKPLKLTATLGYIDRIVYALSFVLKVYPFIGLWLGIKVAARLINSPFVGKDEQDEVFIDEAQRKNAYLIGNVVSLAFGLFGGILIRALFGTQLSVFVDLFK